MTIPLVHDLELATTNLELDESDAGTLVGTDELQTPSQVASWNPKAVGARLLSMLKGALPFHSHLGLKVLIVVGHLLTLALMAGWTSIWFQEIHHILGSNQGNRPSGPPPPAPGQSDNQPSWFDSLFVTISAIVWTVTAFIAFLVGMWGCLVMAIYMAYSLVPYLRIVADPLAHHISRLKPWYVEVVEPLFIARWSPSSYIPLHDQAPPDGGLVGLQTTEGNNPTSGWLEKLSALSQVTISVFKNPGPRMQSFYDIVVYAFRVILHIVAHAAALFPPFAWTTMWSYHLINVWQDGFKATSPFLWIFVLAFLLVCSAFPLGFIGIGFYGCYAILSSFIAPVIGRESWVFRRI